MGLFDSFLGDLQKDFQGLTKGLDNLQANAQKVVKVIDNIEAKAASLADEEQVKQKLKQEVASAAQKVVDPGKPIQDQ